MSGRFGSHTGRDKPEDDHAPPIALQDPARKRLRRQMVGIGESELDDWLDIDPRPWALAHGPALRAAGLTPKDAIALYRRLGPQGALSLAAMIDAGRMADIDIAHIHLWAASGLLKPSAGPSGRAGRGRAMKFTEWVTQARRFTRACGGDEQLAAATAAAGFSVDEAHSAYAAGSLELDGLLTIVALRDDAGLSGN